MIWTYKEKIELEWKKWFAWKPVPIGTYPIQNGTKMVWLQFIERKWLDSYNGASRYAYRLIKEGEV